MRILVHLNETDNFNKINEDILNVSDKDFEIKKIAQTESFYIYSENKDMISKVRKVLKDKYMLNVINDNEDLKCVNCITNKKTVKESFVKPMVRATSPYFYSNEIASIYNLVPTKTTRVLIGVIELGGGYYESDLTRAWQLMGLTTVVPIVNSISIDGAVNDVTDVDSSMEVALDVQIIGGICPNSTINVYFAPNTTQGFYDAIANAISDNCTTISISWAGPERYWSSASLNSYNSLFARAVAKGINVCVASGDNGSNNGTGRNYVLFPSSSPNIVSCGGTKLTSPNPVYDNQTVETTWFDNLKSATGGGYSSFFSSPKYQTTNIPRFNVKRGIPDVAGNAQPNTGWLVVFNNVLYGVGGTSAVAPMWSAYLSSIGCKRFINPIIYGSKGQGFHDVKIGINGGYKASTGWDPTTGWGSPNGSVLTPSL